MKVILTGLTTIKGDFMGPDDVAVIVGVSMPTVRRWIHAPDGLGHTKIGGSIRIHRQSLVNFLNANAVGVQFCDPKEKQ